MEISIKRGISLDGATLGHMSIDGVPECFTLEDVIRPSGEKVYGQTAIPAGRYQVIIDWSNRFQKPMPHVLNVPGFEGIRIHCGNTAADTEGCILLGSNATRSTITGSKVAFDKFFPKLQAALKAGPVFITIS